MAEEKPATEERNGDVPPQPPAAAAPSSEVAPDRSAILADILGTSPQCMYVKKKLLGQGSFGSAWKVEKSATGEIFAAKLMDTKSMSAKDRGFVANEVRCLSRCNNPHIIRHEESYERDGMLLIIMEFANGGDLYRQIKGRQQSLHYFREHEIMFIFLQLAIALDHIHMKKMMHRDLKTANVLLTTNGLIKLGDFGFSRQYEDSLSNPVGTTFCGTPYYLSPELWNRAPYSKKSEMWALGVVLYEVMALRRPYGGRNMDELINNILHGRRHPLPTMYSEELRGICDQLMSLEPENRPSLRKLFRHPFMKRSLKTLQRSVQSHTRIEQSVRDEVSQCVQDILDSDMVEYESSRVVPRTGKVKRHKAGSGWRDCELTLDEQAVTMTDTETGVVESVPLVTITSVCSIDASITGEPFVFAMKNQRGKAFWFKDQDEESQQTWLNVLRNAMPF